MVYSLYRLINEGTICFWVCVTRLINRGHFINPLRIMNCTHGEYVRNQPVLCVPLLDRQRPCGPMDKASDYGSGDSRFESWRGRYFYENLLMYLEGRHLISFSITILNTFLGRMRLFKAINIPSSSLINLVSLL